MAVILRAPGFQACRTAAVLLAMCCAAAAQVEVTAKTDRTDVPLNGRVMLSIRIDGSQDAPTPDLTLEDFEVQYIGPATSVSMVNGRIWTSVTHKYFLLPRREGDLVIGPIEVDAGGSRYTIQPIRVRVHPAVSAQRMAPQPDEPDPAPEGLEQALKFQIGLDQTTAYVNEAVPARLQLVVQGVGLRELGMPELKADGFLVQPMGRPTESRLIVEGQEVALFAFPTTLTPVRPGRLTVGPAAVDGQILVRRRPRSSRSEPSPFPSPFEEMFGDDSPFGSLLDQVRLQPVTVQAQPVAVTVLPLPDEGRPAGFAGAVGRFELEASVVPRSVAAGDPVALRMTVRGRGNFAAVTAPSLAARDGLKVYEAQRLENEEPSEDMRVYEQILIPLGPDVSEIPPVQWSFFDPVERRYHTLTQGPFPLSVSQAASGPAAPGAMPEPDRPEDAVAELAPLKHQAGRWVREPGPWRPSPAWCAALLAGLAAALLSEAARRRHERLSRNPALARASRALSRARQRLAAAERHHRAGQVLESYAEVFRALQGYAEDRLDLPGGSLTASEIDAALRPRGVSDAQLTALGQLLHRCDEARFAPMRVASEQLQPTIASAEQLLRGLEQRR